MITYVILFILCAPSVAIAYAVLAKPKQEPDDEVWRLFSSWVSDTTARGAWRPESEVSYKAFQRYYAEIDFELVVMDQPVSGVDENEILGEV